MVRLKESALAIAIMRFSNFNSTMVRLKVWRCNGSRQGVKNFNSTMVRLKEVKLPDFFAPAGKFQFHYGSVKRRGQKIS